MNTFLLHLITVIIVVFTALIVFVVAAVCLGWKDRLSEKGKGWLATGLILACLVGVAAATARL